jgi:DNA-directed RNA polymerase beta' subunit
MLTKLTLTIDNEIIDKAKKYAQMKHRSVSKIVEEYLRNVSGIEDRRNRETKYNGKLTNAISGMFKNEYKGQSYNDLLESGLAERYL